MYYFVRTFMPEKALFEIGAAFAHFWSKAATIWSDLT